MTLVLGVQGLQLLAWLFALVELILAFYVLALNARHPANRHLSILVFLLALNNLALGLFVGAESPEQALLPSYLFAATSFIIGPGVTVVAIVLLRPGFFKGRWRWAWRSLYIFVFLLPILTLIDFAFGTRFWYTGINVSGYVGGYIALQNYVSPGWYVPAMIFYGYIAGLLPFFPIVATLRDKETSPVLRQLAWIIFAAQVIILLIQGALRTVLPPVTKTFIGTAAYAIAYVYTAFQQMVSERRLQRGQLRARLTLMFLSITIPVLVISVVLVGFQARSLLMRTETQRLGAVANMLADALDLEEDPDQTYLSELVRRAEIEVGDTGEVYIVDEENEIIVHSKLAFDLVDEDDPMRNFSGYVPVAALRTGRGDDLVVFSDENDMRWWAYSTELNPKRWGIVVQQEEAVLAETMREFMNLSWLVVIVGVTLLSLLGFLTVRQAFSPLMALTRTARAVAAGDIEREAVVESEDEIGELALAFNSVTSRLNALIGGLEARVAERTADVERRAEYLAITGGLSRVAASILDADALLDRVVSLISERFNFYHTGIFLIDAAREWAELRAASSAGGQRMLARAHRLRIGEEGIVGYVSDTGRPRIALDVDEDVVWAQNPDLPETRSEMALPLMIGDEIIGVLDVQSTESQAFGEEDVATLRILADQMAVAIRNAQLFEDSQRTLRELQRVYSTDIRQGWAARQGSVVGYRFTPATVQALTSVENQTPIETEGVYVGENNTLFVPMQMAGTETFGYLQLQRDAARPWTGREIAFVNAAAQDVSQALEVSRLLEQSRQTASREQLIGEIASRMRESLEIDQVLRTAVQEFGQLAGVSEVKIHIAPGA